MLVRHFSPQLSILHRIKGSIHVVVKKYITLAIFQSRLKDVVVSVEIKMVQTVTGAMVVQVVKVLGCRSEGQG